MNIQESLRFIFRKADTVSNTTSAKCFSERKSNYLKGYSKIIIIFLPRRLSMIN